jgi:hypothetical protein
VRQRPDHVGGVLAARDGGRVVVERLDVPQLVEPCKARVAHPELIALVDVRGASAQMQHGCKRLRGLLPVLRGVGAEPADGARLVVVPEVEAVPPDLGQPVLPTPERPLELEHRRRHNVPLPLRAGVEVDVLELEYHVQLAARRVGVEHRLLH